MMDIKKMDNALKKKEVFLKKNIRLIFLFLFCVSVY